MRRQVLLGLISLIAVRGEEYCFGFLNAHPDRKEIPEAQAEEIQKGHMAHMNRMALAGHLLAAGPLMTPGGARGILVYRCQSLDQVREWTALDPTVQNKRLTLEVYKWRGPDGVGEPLSSKLKADPNTKIEMTRLPLLLFRKTEKWTGDGPAEALAEHRRGSAELRRQGKIRMLGPMIDADSLAGLWVMSGMPLEEAKALAEKDALVRGGYARVDGYVWFVADEAIPSMAR